MIVWIPQTSESDEEITNHVKSVYTNYKKTFNSECYVNIAGRFTFVSTNECVIQVVAPVDIVCDIESSVGFVFPRGVFEKSGGSLSVEGDGRLAGADHVEGEGPGDQRVGLREVHLSECEKRNEDGMGIKGA